jgi:tetratricopeptide (TPR) repeat protein
MKTRSIARPSGIALLVGLLFLAGSSLGRAEPVAAAASCDADARCAQLANEGLDQSQAGRFDAAQRSYEAAYARQPDAKLLFNLARVLHKAGRLPQAILYYQKYLDAGAEGSEEYRLKAEQRLAEARREQSLAVTGAGAAPDAPRRVPVYRKWWFWTVIGVAAAGVAVGVGVGVAAQSPDLTGYTVIKPFDN